MTTIGFIGTGNMGGALARAASRSGKAEKILLANRTREKAELLAKEIGGEVCDNVTAAAESDYLFLGVKPQFLAGMLEGIRDDLKEKKDRQVIVSMVAGRDLKTLEEMFEGAPVIRIMPNMPTKVGKGLSLYCFSDKVTVEEKQYFLELMGPSGILEEADEGTMLAAGGVFGCGPAFTAMYVEALADGAVACGLPRKKAIRYAAEMLKGTADLLLETGEHPGELKDSVCSPAGSTIQGVRVLEEYRFRAGVINAVIETRNKKF
ncbi:MAG: pyrroline-5-carboxylate reductase [Erysipelotrichaceae bacterium]|nr:pyrroline-5-carboxylate reductase [Erysipelotrichaceae bacterium]